MSLAEVTFKYKIHQNAFATGALTRTPLGELADPLAGLTYCPGGGPLRSHSLAEKEIELCLEKSGCEPENNQLSSVLRDIKSGKPHDHATHGATFFFQSYFK